MFRYDFLSFVAVSIEALSRNFIMNALMPRLAELLLSSSGRAGRVLNGILSSKLETRHPRATVVVSRYLAARPSTRLARPYVDSGKMRDPMCMHGCCGG
jgi:hypothetical protein